MTAAKKNQGVKLAAAFVFLVGAAVLAVRVVLPEPAHRLASQADAAAATEDPHPAANHAPRVDTLAMFGSYDPRSRVANPFAWVEPPAPVAAPDPSRPSKNPDPEAPRAGWLPERTEPTPQHVVTMVLLASSVARAVVDGRVVGVGDRLGSGTVARITPQGVLVADGDHHRFYGLAGVGAGKASSNLEREGTGREGTGDK